MTESTNKVESTLLIPGTQLVEQLIQAHGMKGTFKTLAKLGGYEEAPPTVQEFIDDPFYAGDMIGGDKIYPIWRAAMYEIYPNPFYSPYLEVVLTGSIGQGKSTMAIAGCIYDMCKLLHVKDPHEKYKLLKSTKLVLGLFNATKSLAGTVLWDQIISWMQNSPFFKREMKKSSGLTLLPKQIDMMTGSRSSDALGKAVFSAILSEINFQNKVANQAYDNYNGIKSRLQSRFMNNTGTYPGRMWLDSSKTDSGSFVDDYILKDRETTQDIRVFDNPIWKVLPPWKMQFEYPGFKVFIGNEFKDPFIIERADQAIGLDDSHIIEVPANFEPNFRRDIFKSLQDLGGISTQAAHRFIPSAERIENAMKRDNPIRKEVISTDMYNKDERLIDFIDFSMITPDRRPRFIHVDLGVAYGGDKCGIACTRLDGIIEIDRFDMQAGRNIKQTQPIYHTDWIMFIEARPGQEVPIYKIKNLMVDLRARGYPVVMVTTDGYQSTNLRQDLLLEGFATELLSLDRSPDGYVEFKLAILEERWSGTRHPILTKEIKDLERTPKGKIDHPHEGSKDGADAVAGSLYSAKLNMHRFRANTTSEEITGALAQLSAPKNAWEAVFQTGAFTSVGPKGGLPG